MQRSAIWTVGDIAVVAVEGACGGAHSGKTYELNGRKRYRNQELARRISKPPAAR